MDTTITIPNPAVAASAAMPSFTPRAAEAASPDDPGISAVLDSLDALNELSGRMTEAALTPRQLGAMGEQYAAVWLERRGCTILDRNWRSRYGELDLVALSPERMVLFVEVKTRRSMRNGTPQEAVTPHKRLALRRTGVQWLTAPEHRIAHRGVRFDVISIIVPFAGRPSLNHIREAF